MTNSEIDLTVGRVERVPLRDVWRNEAHHFTPWLAENPDALDEATGLSLTTVEREHSTGNFNVDLVAEDSNGDKVVIENQLEKSDHDHLGKLITYLAAVPEAKTAIWISSDPRPEHVEAINLLNESAQADLYLLKLEAIRIGDSMPAPILTMIVGPSAEARSVAETKKEWAAREHDRHAFWAAFIATQGEVLPELSRISPSTESWIGIGRAYGSQLQPQYPSKRRLVNVYFNTGTKELNKELFDELYAQRADIEAEFGAPLEWVKAENLNTSQIKVEVPNGGYKSEQSEWPSIHAAMSDTTRRLIDTFRGRIAKLSS